MALEDRLTFTENEIVSFGKLDERWPHATEDEIYELNSKRKLRAFKHLKGPINGVIFCAPSKIYQWDGEYNYSEVSYWLLSDVIKCEQEYPDFIGNIAAIPYDNSDPENWGRLGCDIKNDPALIQDIASRPIISDDLLRNNIVLVIDADGTTCPPELASFPIKIFFTEIPKPDDGDFYTSHALMERYKLGPAEFVEYLM